MPRGVFQRESIESRFWRQVDVFEGDKCWIWSGCRDKRGYGFIAVKRKSTGAHRVSWEINNGPIPSGLDVLHKCDNPPCVNPWHLFLGTQSDNNKDKASKNRSHRPKGESNPNVKLTYEQVLLIKNRLGMGEKVSAIALDFKVKWNAIWRIKKGIYWK